MINEGHFKTTTRDLYVIKATTGGRNANFHTTSLPPLVALTIIVETEWTCGHLICSKDLGHFWLGYIRMLGHLHLSAHLPNFESKVLGLSLTYYKCCLDIGTVPIESAPHPLSSK